MLNDLKARGVKDILISCIDGLKRLPRSYQYCFPQTEIQLCIVHQIRSSIKLVASKDQKRFISNLKTIYQAPSLEAAEANLNKMLETSLNIKQH